MAMYGRVADLPLSIDEYALTAHERDTSSGFARTTTEISLAGQREEGAGEDVTYDRDDHVAFREAKPHLSLAGEWTVGEFSRHLAETDLFHGREPGRPDFRAYRRWGFESAALDLALKQADTHLATELGMTYDPVRFVVSTRLGDPPTIDRVEAWLDIDPGIEFKLDPTSDWSRPLMDAIAATGAVRALDLKGRYEGTVVDQAGDPELYAMLLEAFPEAVIEDPQLNAETRPMIAEAVDRLAWDAPIHGLADIHDLPWEPAWLNIKPSRFGSVRSLFEAIEHCRGEDIRMYGGGQFELGVGRAHIQAIASLFYPGAPNDVAPRSYNAPEPRRGLPSSPLVPSGDPVGLEWSFGA